MRSPAALAVILGLTSAAFAQQAGKVSQMPFASTPLGGTELLYLVQNGISVKCTVTQCGLGPGTSNLTITDGINIVNNTNRILFNNATVGGVTPNGTVTIPLLTVTDGTHTVTGTKQLSVSGGTIGGATPNATLTITPGTSGWTLTDGSTTINGVTHLLVNGATASGSSPNGVLTIPPFTLAVGSTPITGGTSNYYLYDSGGLLANAPLPAPGVTFTDGTHTVAAATQLTVTGGTIGGTTPNGTLTIAPASTALTVGTTVVNSGTSGFALTDNAGILGNVAIPTLTYAANADIWAHSSTTEIINPSVAATSIAPQTVTDSSGTYSIDFNTAINLELTLVHADCPCTIPNPINVYAGLSGNMTITQSTTGSDTIGTWGSTWKFFGGSKPLLSTGANAIDVLPFYCRTTTFCVVTDIANVQ